VIWLPLAIWVHFRFSGVFGLHGGGEQEHIFTLGPDCTPLGHTAITCQEKQLVTEVGITVLVAAIVKLDDDGGRPFWQQAGSFAVMITL
jgi:hypothetical protein